MFLPAKMTLTPNFFITQAINALPNESALIVYAPFLSWKGGVRLFMLLPLQRLVLLQVLR